MMKQIKAITQAVIKFLFTIITLLTVFSCEKDTIIKLNDRGEWYITVYTKEVNSQRLYFADTNNVVHLPCMYEKNGHNVRFLDAKGREIGAESIKYFGHRNEYEYNYYIFYLATTSESKLPKTAWEGGRELELSTYKKKMWLIEDLIKQGYQSVLQRCDTASVNQ